MLKTRKDTLGMWMSGLCIVHCIVTPILVVSLGAGLAISWLASEWVHVLLFIPILFLVATSIVPTFANFQYWPGFLLAIAGLLSLAASFAFHGWLEEFLAVAGGTCVFVAHYLNARFLRCLNKKEEDLTA